jgi:hypothetical protein
VHATGRYNHNSLLSLLVAQRSRGLHTVHRLDRLTSGLTLLAKIPAAARRLTERLNKEKYLVDKGRADVAQAESVAATAAAAAVAATEKDGGGGDSGVAAAAAKTAAAAAATAAAAAKPVAAKTYVVQRHFTRSLFLLLFLFLFLVRLARFVLCLSAYTNFTLDHCPIHSFNAMSTLQVSCARRRRVSARAHRVSRRHSLQR